MSRDGYTVLAAFLRADEAEMLRGVLESAGISSVVEDAAIASLNLESAIGGAKVLVPFEEAEAAREIAFASGVLPGGESGPVEIGPSEWRIDRGPGAGAEIVAIPRADGDPDLLSRRALGAALLALPLAFTIVVPLWAIAAAVRAVRARPAVRRARLRGAWAATLAIVSIALAGGFWVKLAPELGRRAEAAQRDRGTPSMPRPPRAPFP